MPVLRWPLLGRGADCRGLGTASGSLLAALRGALISRFKLFDFARSPSQKTGGTVRFTSSRRGRRKF